jgi:hypothetical protein
VCAQKRVDVPVGHDLLGYQVTCLGLVLVIVHLSLCFGSVVLAFSFLAISPCFGKVLCLCILELLTLQS